MSLCKKGDDVDGRETIFAKSRNFVCIKIAKREGNLESECIKNGEACYLLFSSKSFKSTNMSPRTELAKDQSFRITSIGDFIREITLLNMCVNMHQQH